MVDATSVIKSMQTSRVRDYIIPGLNSYMLEDGKVRMFESTRDFSGTVTPHTHRFDFTCLVLQGIVRNRVYEEVSPLIIEEERPPHDLFTVRTIGLDVNEAFGDYERITQDYQGARFTSETTEYLTGDWYSMGCDEYHSIEFGRDTKVLFFEGPQRAATSKVLLPFMHNETIETMKTEDWMFLED